MKTERDQILFVSSYPPRECGIATFTRDLVHAFNSMFDRSYDVRVCALNEEGSGQRTYPPEVTATLNTADKAHCAALAVELNAAEKMAGIVIEHEFGLFPGEYGNSIFNFIDLLEKPLFVCFHTVLDKPDEKMLAVVSRIAARARKLIVLTQHSKEILQADYHIPGSQITVIPHGVHQVKPVGNRQAMKEKYGFGDKIILGTFGLISSNKGIETALEAIAALPDRSNVLYLVMGKTHPCVQRHEGERYRDFLVARTRELGITDNVLFINKYLELKELLTYLKLTDIYLFTSRDPKQTVSGTLSYAMGSGCAVVSTPIPHAKEALTDDTGFIFNFGDSRQLSEIIHSLISSPEKVAEASRRAALKARSSSWENVANRFAELFSQEAGRKVRYNLPSLKLAHFCRLNNPNGIIQFSRLSEPDIDSGYTTDDNARALYVMTLYNELYPNDPFISRYFGIYLGFLEKAIRPDGSFLNYMNHDGMFTSANSVENLDEANARAFVALSRFIQSLATPEEYRTRAQRLVARSFHYACALRSPRSMAKVIKALYYLDLHDKKPVHKKHIQTLSAELLKLHSEVSTTGWHWFEPYLTYNNSAMPEGLMYAYLATNDARYKRTAERTLSFLLGKLMVDGRLRVISNNGWVSRDKPYVHRYGEQPIEVAAVIEALYIFYQATAEEKYREHMDTAFSWFLGNNHLGRMVYNIVNGGCHDGIEEFEVNGNQGAESTLSYIVSRLTMDKLNTEDSFMSDIFTYSNDRSVHNN